MIRVDESDPIGEIEAPFPYKDVTIKRNTDVKDYYEMLSEIGRGKFGTVYHCKEKSTGLELAVKMVVVSRRDERRTVEREIEVMKKLRHPRLIQLYDAYDNGKIMSVVLELIQGGELFERVIDDDFILTEKSCTVFMRQICEGIEFVHQQNILHLDMKPENILCLTKEGNRIKIIDFGLARLYDPDKKLQVLFGTPEFVAPEVVNFEQIGFGTDMWSIGVICYVLLSGLSPFMGETDVETMANVTVAKYDFEDEAFNEISEDAKDFIRKLLLKDKQARMTSGQCLQHKWLQRRTQTKRESIKTDTPAQQSETSPSPPRNELDVTKDNLRVFVERWGEHPNSPYVFDITTHEIKACEPDEDRSLGACSPSPRSSLSSSPDGVLELEESNRKNSFLSPRLNPVERRASDSYTLLHRKPDVSVRVNLADEIKKLSDRLYQLSTNNSEKTTQAQHCNVETSTKNSTTTRKMVTSKSTNKINYSFLEDKNTDPVTSNPPWVKGVRTKFKITNQSRDVPEQPLQRRLSGFGEEFDRRREKIDKFVSETSSRRVSFKSDDECSIPARRTKDLLLQLLDKLDTDNKDDDVTVKTKKPIRHKSISMEWSDTDRASHRSISSLNAFFKKQTASDITQQHKTKIIKTNGIK